MFRTGDITDFNRMLQDRLGRAQAAAAGEALKVESDFIAKGCSLHSGLPNAIEQKITPIHENAIGEVMRLMTQFSERTGVAIADLSGIARSALTTFTEQILTRMITAANRMNLTQAISEFRARFNRRVDHALQDIQIGFIQGESAAMTESQQSQAKAMRLLKSVYQHTHSRSEPIFVTELNSETGLTQAEAEASWRYLKDKSLIDTFKVPFTAIVSARGCDAIENAQKHPDRPITGFPSITYNVLNIGHATNSPIQQAGAHSIFSTASNSLAAF